MNGLLMVLRGSVDMWQRWVTMGTGVAWVEKECEGGVRECGGTGANEQVRGRPHQPTPADSPPAYLGSSVGLS